MFVLVAFRVYSFKFPGSTHKTVRCIEVVSFFLSEWCPVKSFNNKDFNQLPISYHLKAFRNYVGGGGGCYYVLVLYRGCCSRSSRVL